MFLAELQEAFALFDRDGDGCVTVKDLNRVMNQVSLDLQGHFRFPLSVYRSLHIPSKK